MRVYFVLYSFIVLLASCAHNSGPANDSSSSDNEIRKEVMSIAEKYVSDQLKDAKITKAKNGAIVISDNKKMFVIDPSKIYLGLIDDDSKTDAIVSLDCFSGQYQTTSEHLILLSKDGKITFNRAVESDMRIIEIKDRLITADVPSHSRNSPLFDCKSCREVIKYQFHSGELVKMD